MPEWLDLDILLALAMFLAAALYSSVGHAGASAYIALMALFGLAPEEMRPAALVLNILVGSIAAWRYGRAGLTDWQLLWPFLAGSMPFAFLGGAIQLPGQYYKPLVGAVLLLAAMRLLWPRPLQLPAETSTPSVPKRVGSGAVIGLLSGLTGTGGGIFLSPLLLFLGWAQPRAASGVAASFILGNSVAGLAGNYSAVRNLPESLPLFAFAVMAGAAVGTTLGIRFTAPIILRALGLVLAIAGVKLLTVA